MTTIRQITLFVPTCREWHAMGTASEKGLPSMLNKSVSSTERCANDVRSKIIAQSITQSHTAAGHSHHRRAIGVACASLELSRGLISTLPASDRICLRRLHLYRSGDGSRTIQHISTLNCAHLPRVATHPENQTVA